MMRTSAVIVVFVAALLPEEVTAQTAIYVTGFPGYNKMQKQVNAEVEIKAPGWVVKKVQMFVFEPVVGGKGSYGVMPKKGGDIYWGGVKDLPPGNYKVVVFVDLEDAILTTRVITTSLSPFVNVEEE